MKCPTLNEEDPIPIGKYKGRKLKDVPPSYLLFFWDKVLKFDTNSLLGKYIHDNANDLMNKTKPGPKFEEEPYLYEEDQEPLDAPW